MSRCRVVDGDQIVGFSDDMKEGPQATMTEEDCRQLFEELDSNGDGKLSFKEIKRGLGGLLTEAAESAKNLGGESEWTEDGLFSAVAELSLATVDSIKTMRSNLQPARPGLPPKFELSHYVEMWAPKIAAAKVALEASAAERVAAEEAALEEKRCALAMQDWRDELTEGSWVEEILTLRLAKIELCRQDGSVDLLYADNSFDLDGKAQNVPRDTLRKPRLPEPEPEVLTECTEEEAAVTADGTVKLKEGMGKIGRLAQSASQFFKAADRDGGRSLDFNEFWMYIKVETAIEAWLRSGGEPPIGFTSWHCFEGEVGATGAKARWSLSNLQFQPLRPALFAEALQTALKELAASGAGCGGKRRHLMLQQMDARVGATNEAAADLVRLDDEKLALNTAATRIQTRYRGNRSRHLARQLRQEKRERAAAVEIQRHQRGAAQRTRDRHRRRWHAATKLQCICRTAPVRAEFRAWKVAATRGQTWWRGKKGRAGAAERRAERMAEKQALGSLLLQRLCRRWLIRAQRSTFEEEHKRHVYACVLQRRWRAILARANWRELFAAGRNQLRRLEVSGREKAWHQSRTVAGFLITGLPPASRHLEGLYVQAQNNELDTPREANGYPAYRRLSTCDAHIKGPNFANSTVPAEVNRRVDSEILGANVGGYLYVLIGTGWASKFNLRWALSGSWSPDRTTSAAWYPARHPGGPLPLQEVEWLCYSGRQEPWRRQKLDIKALDAKRLAAYQAAAVAENKDLRRMAATEEMANRCRQKEMMSAARAASLLRLKQRARARIRKEQAALVATYGADEGLLLEQRLAEAEGRTINIDLSPKQRRAASALVELSDVPTVTDDWSAQPLVVGHRVIVKGLKSTKLNSPFSRITGEKLNGRAAIVIQLTSNGRVVVQTGPRDPVVALKRINLELDPRIDRQPGQWLWAPAGDGTIRCRIHGAAVCGTCCVDYGLYNRLSVFL
eukprot:SAG31_NODE_1334_length_8741_cov_4.311618_4_plen_961_part_00